MCLFLDFLNITCETVVFDFKRLRSWNSKWRATALLSIAGTVSLVIGSIMLTDLPASWLSLSWQPILTVALLAIILFLGVLTYVIRAQLAKVKTGREGLVGETGSSGPISPLPARSLSTESCGTRVVRSPSARASG